MDIENEELNSEEQQAGGEEAKNVTEDTGGKEEKTNLDIINEVAGPSQEEIEASGGNEDEEDGPINEGITDDLERRAYKPEDEPKKLNLSPEDTEILESLSERGQKRFREIQHTAQEVTAERDDLQAKLETVVPVFKLIHESGVDPVEMDRWLRVQAMTRTNPEMALEEMDRQRAALARSLNKEVPGVDLLADFPDIQEMVEDREISRDIALQLANARRMEMRQHEHAKYQEQSQEQQRQYSAILNNTLTQVTELERQWRSTNPDYATIEREMEQAVASITKTVQPDKWVPALVEHYNELKAVAEKLAKKNARQNPPTLRPGGSGDVRKSGIETTLETIERIANGG